MLVVAIASACLLLALVLFVYEDPFYRRVAPIAFLIHLAFGLVVVPALPYVWDVGYFHTTAIDLLEGTDPDASDVDSLFHFAAAAYTPVVIVLVVSAARSLRRVDPTYPVATMLVVYLAGITGYGLVNSNFGTTVRHRVFFDFLLVVLAAPVVERWEQSVSERVSERPREHDDEDEQDGEARKLYARRQIGTEDGNDARHDGS